VNSVYLNRLRPAGKTSSGRDSKWPASQPGVYLIRLRSHLAQGKSAFDRVISFVPANLPAPVGLRSAEAGEVAASE
jgi:hypothetical protein